MSSGYFTLPITAFKRCLKLSPDNGHGIGLFEQCGLVLRIGSDEFGDAERLFEDEVGALRNAQVLFGQHQVGFAVGALLGLEFDGQVETAFEDAAHAVQVGLMRRRIVVEREFDLHRSVAGRRARVDHRCERVAVVGPLPGLRKARVGQFFAVDLYRLGREDGREAQLVAAAVGRARKRTPRGAKCVRAPCCPPAFC